MKRGRQLLISDWLQAEGERRSRPQRRRVQDGDQKRDRDALQRTREPANRTVDFDAAWPSDIDRLFESADPHAVQFSNANEDLGLCRCAVECTADACDNVKASVFCTDDNCGVGPDCGNRLRELPALRLVRGAMGLGVGTNCWLQPGVVVGQYCGVLKVGDTLSDKMRSSGFTFEFGERSVSKQKVYIDASERGGLARFMNHSCAPNCRFQVFVHRAQRKVAIVTQEAVPPGGELTVQYCERPWFQCRCVVCSAG